MKFVNLLPLCPSQPFPQSSLLDSNWLELRNGIIVPLFLACPQLWSSIVIHNNKNLCTYILTTSTLKLVDSLLNKSHKNCPRNRLIIAHNLLPKSSLKLNAECRKLSIIFQPLNRHYKGSNFLGQIYLQSQLLKLCHNEKGHLFVGMFVLSYPFFKNLNKLPAAARVQKTSTLTNIWSFLFCQALYMYLHMLLGNSKLRTCYPLPWRLHLCNRNERRNFQIVVATCQQKKIFTQDRRNF